MKILNIDKKNNFVKLLLNSKEDLFHLEYFIEEGDLLTSKTFRKAFFESGSERKEVLVEILVLKLFFREETNTLRIFGKIVNGYPQEYVQIGKHHSLELGVGDVVEIRKSKLYNFQIFLLKEWEKETKKPIFLFLAMDEEKATIANVFPYGIGNVKEIRSGLSKRLDEKEFKKKEEEYLNKVSKIVNNSKAKIAIVCGPGFEKEKIIPLLKIEVFSFYSTSSELSAIYEVMKSKDFLELSKKLMLKQEEYYVEKLIEEISKSGNYAIGLEDVSKYAYSKRIKVLLVTNSMLKKKEVKEIIEIFKNFGGTLRIINEKTSAGKQLLSLGGIGALLT
ncbi:MAG: hypothetical protein ACP5FX_01295 [Candidatus Micrarchaeia archaeon]